MDRRNANRITVSLALSPVLLAAATVPVMAQAGGDGPGVHTPKVGSPERKALMDALRVPVERDLKMPVTFLITHPEIFLRVDGNWAFVGGEYRHADGTPVKITDAQDASGFSNQVTALLHRVHGKWQVVEHDTGAVDVGWPDWIQKHHAPEDLLDKQTRTSMHTP